MEEEEDTIEEIIEKLLDGRETNCCRARAELAMRIMEKRRGS